MAISTKPFYLSAVQSAQLGEIDRIIGLLQMERVEFLKNVCWIPESERLEMERFLVSERLSTRYGDGQEREREEEEVGSMTNYELQEAYFEIMAIQEADDNQ